MVWFKVDDTLAFHRKVLKAGNAAMGMWVRAGAECASQLTDGFVTDELALTIGPRSLASKLVAAGLWDRVEGGYRFHEWSTPGRQPTRHDVEAEREAARLRKQKSRKSHTVTDDELTRAVTPTPTRPDQVTPLRGVRGTRLPDDFAITADMARWCSSRGITKAQAMRSTESFVNYWRAKTGRDATKLDWPATWRNWLLRDHPDATPDALDSLNADLNRQLLS